METKTTERTQPTKGVTRQTSGRSKAVLRKCRTNVGRSIDERDGPNPVNTDGCPILFLKIPNKMNENDLGERATHCQIGYVEYVEGSRSLKAKQAFHKLMREANG